MRRVWYSSTNSNTLKIDRAFISGIPKNSANVTLVTSIAAMAHGLGLTIIGEGVETPEQLDFLRKTGCQIIQGYHFAKPMTAEDFTAYWDANKPD